MKSQVTLKTIAKALNLSTSTVSRALADQWDVNSQTKRNRDGIGHQIKLQAQYHGSET